MDGLTCLWLSTNSHPPHRLPTPIDDSKSLKKLSQNPVTFDLAVELAIKYIKYYNCVFDKATDVNYSAREPQCFQYLELVILEIKNLPLT